MEQVSSFTQSVIGTLALLIVLFALGACGPRVVSGNEHSVTIEKGAWSTRSTTESYAQTHCEHYGKRPSYAGGENIRGSLHYIYWYNCVAGG